jgi:hypothetical protein
MIGIQAEAQPSLAHPFNAREGSSGASSLTVDDDAERRRSPAAIGGRQACGHRTLRG